MKRFFDMVVATILLLIFVPILFIVALCLKFDSPGPVLYASPRIGKDGKRFGQFRFRTVRLDKPGYLSMRERLSRVGRFIRNYSLDDLPNLFNILRGDLSIVGPRPTEPERVDLADPLWQKILSVRPGVISPAIMILGQQYNASPNTLKQQLEAEYVQNHSFVNDLRLFWQGLRGFYVSKGNWKARGTPAMAIEYAQYQEKSTPSPITSESDSSAYSWVITDWEQPDLTYVNAVVQEQGHSWEAYEPQLCLVPCAGSVQKPAIFLRVDKSHALWGERIELHDIQWLVASTNRYVCLGCVLCFANGSTYSTLVDVASPTIESWFSTWKHGAGIILFVVSDDLKKIRHHLWSGNDAGAKVQAIQQWQEVKARLRQAGFALENFIEEAVLLRRTLKSRSELRGM
jgi:lipopolysaccharide/colanic/teichoic acid biosynthesis glycosyltransferase